MADYVLTKLPIVSDMSIYEVRLPDGVARRFHFARGREEAEKKAFNDMVAISVRRAKLDSDYLKANRG